MKLLLLLEVVVSILFVHKPIPNPFDDKDVKYKSIKLEMLVSLLDGQIISGYDTSSNNFIYKEDLTVFKSEYGFDSLSNMKLVKSETRYNYLVYSRGEKKGILYNSHDLSQKKTVSVDSLLRFQAFGQMNLDSLIARKDLTQLKDNFSKEGDQVDRIYTIQSKFDPSRKDSIKFSFSKKLNWVDFSFSKKMDDMLGMKLFRIEFSIVSPTDEQHLNNLVNAKMIINMSDATKSIDTLELDHYLNRYNKDKKRLLGY